MSEYKRLTKQAGWHKDIDLTDELGYSYIYQRLSEWENDYENGKVVKLPCKVGDTVYIDGESWRHFIYYKHEFIGGKFFVVGKITSIRITERQIFIRIKAEYRISYYRYSNYPISAIGKTVFPTREEAEKRLKELQE